LEHRRKPWNERLDVVLETIMRNRGKAITDSAGFSLRESACRP
jgi:hypothetical protein